MIIEWHSLADLSENSSILDQVIQLDSLWMQDPWSELSWRNSISASYYLVTSKNEMIKAFALFYLATGDDQAHLLKIAVDPLFRRQGLASQFLIESLAELKQKRSAVSVYLEVRLSNESAIKLYERVGFSSLRIIPGFYQDGESARAMHKEL